MRFLEKWAVTVGGGYNHRFGLYDMIMLKDNHNDYAGGITAALNSSKKYQAVLLAVAHDEFKTLDFEAYHNAGAVVFDAKAVVDRRWVDSRL